MLCPKCNHEAADDSKFCSNCGAKMEKAGIQIEQDVDTVKGSVTGAVIGEGASTTGINATVDQDIETVESGGAVVGAVLGGADSQIHVGGEQRYGDTQEVHTEGGDYVAGDKVGGDKVGGDKISVGSISGSTVAIGRGASASSTQGISGDELAALFAPVLEAIQSAPAAEQEVAQQKLQELEAESSKGDEAEDSLLAELITDLVGLVPAAASAVTSAFASPILAGIAGPVTNFVLKGIGAI